MWCVEHCSDSLALLSAEQGIACDAMITDPPYTEHVHRNLRSGRAAGTKSVHSYTLPFDPLASDSHAWVRDAVRVTRRWVVSFCAVESLGLYDAACPDYVRGALWWKPNSMGQLTADRPAVAYEGIAILHRPRTKKRWNGRGSFGLWRCNGTRGLRDRHWTEKPVNLAMKLVALFSDRGETVLDPFCGSGAIGEACVRLGRSYIGLDQDPTWVARAKARLSRDHDPVTDEYALGLCRAKESAHDDRADSY